jgi:HEAT repeat protein
MTLYCWSCFLEVRPGSGICPRCGKRQDTDQREYLDKLRAALAHPLAETRRRVIFLLGEKRALETVDDLGRIAKTESDPFLAEEAAIALGKIGEDKALCALITAARNRSFMVRARALEALIQAGGHWERLARDLARNDPSGMVRAVAQINS